MGIVKLVDFAGRGSFSVMRALLARVVEIVDALNRRPAGFALVVWDKNGVGSCAYRSGGPVPATLIPTYAYTQLLAAFVES